MMDKYEKLLEEIKIADVEPDEVLVRRTKTACKKMMREGKQVEIANRSKKSRMTVQLLAAAAFIAFVFVALLVSSIRNHSPIDGAAYYTIDINPSFGFSVDEDNNVIGVEFQNDDAEDLYDGMNLIGLKIHEALSLIIQKAQADGYMSGLGDKYVLLGQFMDDVPADEGEEILYGLLAGLESEVGEGIRLIGVSGDTSDLKEADELHVSPGMLILCDLVDEVDAEDGIKMEDIVQFLPDEYNSEPEFAAPVIKFTAINDNYIVSWDEIDFSGITAEGEEVEYKLLKGKTLNEIKEMISVVTSITADVDGRQPTGFSIELTPDEMNEKTYYCLYVQCSNTAKLSNVLPVTVQTSVGTDPTPEPTEDPILVGDELQLVGEIYDGKIALSWVGVEDSYRFDGYKVMYSATDTTPVYGEEGCYYLEFITDVETTSGTYSLSSLKGYEQGKEYYFSITGLFDGHETKIAGNVISRTMPTTTTAAPTATPKPSSEYPTPKLTSATFADGCITLTWNSVEREDLTYYKANYSFIDSSPAYPESTTHSYPTSSLNYCASVSSYEGYGPGETCYVSVTAVYPDGKKTSTVMTVVIPEDVTPVVYPTPTLTSATYAEGNITLTWNSVEREDLTYYKANYSFTNSSPAYQASGTCSWPTNDLYHSKAATSVDGYAPGTTCYVSVTAVYSGGKETSTVMTVVIPEETTPTPTVEPSPTPEPTTPTPSMSSASCDDVTGALSVSWSAVEHASFENYILHYDIAGTSYTKNMGTATSLNVTAETELTGYVAEASCTFWVEAVYAGSDNKTSGTKSCTLHPVTY